MLGMSILCVIFVALGVSAYLLFRLKIKGIVLMIVPVFFLMVMDISSHATRQMVGQSMYGIDIKRAVVTKIPYAEGPIILTFEGSIPVVNEIMLPHGSWTQDITISSFLIHMFYEGE
jgi:hypothetical protein